jgi:hypothetical protein
MATGAMSLGVNDCTRGFRFSLVRCKEREHRGLTILLPIQMKKLNPNFDWSSTEIVVESEGVGSEMANLGCNCANRGEICKRPEETFVADLAPRSGFVEVLADDIKLVSHVQCLASLPTCRATLSQPIGT